MSASNELPIQISFGSLPPNVAWTPQQLGDAIAQRLSLVTSQSFALFVSGSTEPASNVGPWLKNGEEWWIWSDADGNYVPQILSPASLGYFIGNAAPDPNIYSIWISTTVGGSPLAVSTYYNGSWTDVYAAVIGDYMTTAAFTAAIASYSTTAQMNTAIAAGATTYPAQATIETVPQSIPIDGAPHKVVFESAPINPAPAPFNIVANRYIAPAAGIYALGATSQFDNNTGTPAGMEIGIVVYKNGVDAGLGDIDSTPSPNGSRWSPGFGPLLISLAINDYVELWCEASDGVDTGLLDLTTCDFSITRVSAT